MGIPEKYALQYLADTVNTKLPIFLFNDSGKISWEGYIPDDDKHKLGNNFFQEVGPRIKKGVSDLNDVPTNNHQ